MRLQLQNRAHERTSLSTSPKPSGGFCDLPEVPPDDTWKSNLAYQDQALPGVSRTFALTIPALPPDLRDSVTNAYLLCRIADTIEDEPALERDQKVQFQQRFQAVVSGQQDPDALAVELTPLLSDATLDTERELVRNLARVVAVTHALDPAQRTALERCIRVMSAGMAQFQAEDRKGLASVQELHDYCYFVAGVVGEMLTELFCFHSEEIAARGDELRRLSVSFGLGLQLTNILKDIWDDLDRGVCWLPRDLFGAAGVELEELGRGQYTEDFGACLQELVGLAHGHLRNALDYTLLIPPGEQGIRRFCLWALGMAVLTVRKVNANPDFQESGEVKITRRSVKGTILAANLTARSDRSLRALFALFARPLPLSSVDGISIPTCADDHP